MCVVLCCVLLLVCLIVCLVDCLFVCLFAFSLLPWLSVCLFVVCGFIVVVVVVAGCDVAAVGGLWLLLSLRCSP